MSTGSFTLVGAGQASAVAARTLRRRGYDGRIVIVGDEAERPYQRPPLSKELLVEAGDFDDLYLLPEAWCAANDVDIVTGRRALAIGADLAVALDDGGSIASDAVLIATGTRARRLPGAGGERVHYLRTLADARRLRAGLQPGARVVIVGAGFIGAEVAAAARAHDLEVTLVEASATPLESVLGAHIGAACARLHHDNGVRLLTGRGVTAVREHPDHVEVVVGDEVLPADVVVVGIGVEPNVELANASGIATGNGVLVDAACRTDRPGVFAAGDVANHDHPLFGRVRVEHFDNASRQGAAAANAMLGRAVSYAEPHWFWSDQYDSNLQYTGHAGGADEVVIRGSVDELDFTAFYLSGGRLSAAFAIDRGGDVLAAKELIALGAHVPPRWLADEDVDLAELAESAALEPAGGTA